MLDSEFWRFEREELFRLLFPLLTSAALDGAKGGLTALLNAGIGVDWGLVNIAVREWSRRYTFDLVTGITGTTERYLQGALTEWIQSGAPLNALMEQITPMFGPVRAEMISVTEVTRAFAEGNQAAWKESGQVEGNMWMTAEDELVCDYCAPLDGMIAALGENEFTTVEGDIGVTGPPLHVNCRCYLQPVVKL